MQSVREALLKRRWEVLLFSVFFAGALVICHFVPYSDGDDAFFLKMANSMSLPEYLRMRYITWEGRMTSEAMTYAAFRLGHTFWSLVNALMLTLLPGGLLCLMRKIIGPGTTKEALGMALYCFFGMALLGITVLGYGGIWVTGSTFYLWSIVAGIWAAMPFADLVWAGAYRKRSLIYAIPCGFIAAMGLEQITAVSAFGPGASDHGPCLDMSVSVAGNRGKDAVRDCYLASGVFDYFHRESYIYYTAVDAGEPGQGREGTAGRPMDFYGAPSVEEGQALAEGSRGCVRGAGSSGNSIGILAEVAYGSGIRGGGYYPVRHPGGGSGILERNAVDSHGLLGLWGAMDPLGAVAAGGGFAAPVFFGAAAFGRAGQ